MLELQIFDPQKRQITGDIGLTVKKALKEGKILAVKGLGGYHLCCDALNEKAVSLLRQRKNRWEKPFAVMAPDSPGANKFCELSAEEQRLLETDERPIVLLKIKENSPIPEAVAPGQGRLGIMLPYAPWHHLLLEGFSLLVMTSGNLTEEPIAYQDEDAFTRLGSLADFFLLHNSEIARRCDDSLAAVANRQGFLLRRSRGYIFKSISLPVGGPPVLACGGEQKNIICLTKGEKAFPSPHIGDLENYLTLESFENTIKDMKKTLEIEPEVITYDLHPEYLATKFALAYPKKVKLVGVQHHHAHLASALAEHGLNETIIGVAFDGTGYGTDGCIWGGEFLVGDGAAFRRWGHLAYVPMPSGSLAIKEPWRMAAGYLEQVYGRNMIELPLEFVKQLPDNWALLQKATAKGINAPLTSSCGRLFDGVAALLLLKQKVSFEGQAAMLLEKIADPGEEGEYPFTIEIGVPHQIGLKPLWQAIVADIKAGIKKEIISARFHNTISRIILDMCLLIRKETGIKKVALTGGVFQNIFLLEKASRQLQKADFHVLQHHLVPPNDAGLSIGQALVALTKSL